MLVLNFVFKCLLMQIIFLVQIDEFLRPTSLYKLHHNIIYCSCFTMLIFRHIFFVSMTLYFSHRFDQYGRVFTPIHGLFLRSEIYSCLYIHSLSIYCLEINFKLQQN